MLETTTQQADRDVRREHAPAKHPAARPGADQAGSFWVAVEAVRKKYPERMLDHEFDRIDMRHQPSIPDFTSEEYGGYDENGEPVID